MHNFLRRLCACLTAISTWGWDQYVCIVVAGVTSSRQVEGGFEGQRDALPEVYISVSTYECRMLNACRSVF